jgi:tRNA modification GTPase
MSSSPGLTRGSTKATSEAPVSWMAGSSPAMMVKDNIVSVSALTGEGIPDLIAALAARVSEKYDSAAPLLTRARHREALQEAADALRRSLVAELPELRAEDLRLAWRGLGRITGRADVEDLLDVIFADFCLGK